MDYPKYEIEHEFFDSELDYTGRVGIARICDLLQSAATAHADILGVGMTELMKESHTWMLASMSVCFDNWPKSLDKATLTTWPSGVRGKLVCTRDYTITGNDGTPFVKASSDWIYVNIESRRIDRLTPKLLNLAPAEVPRSGVEAAGKIELLSSPTLSQEIIVRHADTDVNRHVNNVHYIEWLFEPLDEARFSRRLLRLDISYRQEARFGDEIISEVEERDDGVTLHLLKRKSDGTPLVAALCRWEA